MKLSFLKSGLLLLFVSGNLAAYGQALGSSGISIPVNQPTENASALTRGGNIPVNFSTGQPVITIPLHEATYNGINVPIHLNYDASGVRIDQHPTWVGQNWNLQAGGVITRNVKGLPDDYVFPDRNNAHFAGTEKGFLFCGNRLNTSNWNTAPFLASSASYFSQPGVWNPNYLADGMPDDYNFQFGAYSGTLFLDEQGIWRVKSQSALSLEVTHEVNDEPIVFATGSTTRMRINKLITKFTITTPDGMQYIFGGDLNAIDYSRGANDNFNLFYDAADLFNISPTAWYLTQIITPFRATINFTYERGLNLVRYYRSVGGSTYATAYSSATNTNDVMLAASVITPCYLKSITTPLQTITFNRSPATQQIFDGITFRKLEGGLWFDRPLSEFDEELWDVQPNISQNRAWQDFRYYDHAHVWQPWQHPRIPDFSLKLDSIVVSDNKATTRKSIRFSYNNIAAERLFLNGVSVSGNDPGPDENYTFDYYNKGQVPNYSSLQKDQWGYYNGTNYASGTMYSNTSWRLPSVLFAVTGTLKTINYPTGGRVTFAFETNNYAQFQKVAFSSPLGATGTVSLESAGGNRDAGGLRIRKITSSAGYGAPDVTKAYYYDKGYVAGGTVSSGILSLRSKYIENSKFTNFCAPGGSYLTLMSDNEFNPYGEEVRSVSYGEVTEVNGDGSKTTYRYSNYDDPGCLDELDNNSFLYNVEESDLYKLTSNALERGLLLSETYYNSGNGKVADKRYEYDYAPGRKQKFAKGIQRFDRLKEQVRATLYGSSEACAEEAIHRLYCYKKYYYNIPLKKVTENTYHGSTTISNAVDYTYDAYGNITTTTTTGSDGQQLISNTRYNSDPAYLATATSPDAIGVKRLFDFFKIKNYPVEQTSQTIANPLALGGSLLTAGTLFRYNQYFPFVEQVMRMELAAPFKPVTFSGMTPVHHYTASGINASGDLAFDSRYKLQEAVTAYSTNSNMVKGRPLAVSRPSGDETYTWDYRSQFLTSVTRNATPLHTAYTSFEGDYQVIAPLDGDDNMGGWLFNKNAIGNGGAGGDKCLNLPIGAAENIKSAANLQNGKAYVLSFWFKGNFPQLKNGTTFFGSGYPPAENWTYVEFTFTGNGGQVSVTAPASGNPLSSAYVDEVRLYPVGASMKTNTYDPVTGAITSEGNENGDLRLYRYDGLGRLTDIRDSKGNILKQYSYQNQGPQ